jgi:fatty-acyl-CoA synthase
MTPLYQMNIGSLLNTPLANAPGQEIIHADVMRYSYRELRKRIGRLGSVLTALGVKHGSVVAVMDWDSHRYLECYFAVPMLGAVLHTVNVRLSPEQVLYTINHAEDDLILVHADFVPLVAGIIGRVTRPVKIVFMQDRAEPVPEGMPFAGEYEALLESADAGHVFPEFDENTRATLFYTTGTTGDPKGVSFSHRQVVLHTLGMIAALSPVPGTGGLHRADVYMPITPMFHVHAWGVPYVATLLGIRQVYPGRYEPVKLINLIAMHGVTFTHCVPTVLNMILSAPESAAVDLSGWKVLIGGSALTPGLAQAALARGIDVHTGYGMSETAPLLTLSDMVASQGAGDTVPIRTATGKAAPLVELSLRDENMNPVPHDGVSSGEITVRAPWLTESYLKSSEGTVALWRGGWLHTGDIATIAPDGTVRIGDRVKDVIKSGGEWVSSLDLEGLASRVAGVGEVAAVGLPDERWGERPCLAVTLVAGADGAAVDAGIRAVMKDCVESGRLPKWAMPDRIEVLDALPKTSVGKLDKKRMRVMFAIL